MRVLSHVPPSLLLSGWLRRPLKLLCEEAEKTNLTNANSNAGRVASKLKKYSVNPNKRY
ncbi:hypothetical protein HIE11_004225 [Escherichia coli]|nr:hypothetical protein [Escherichia coli]